MSEETKPCRRKFMRLHASKIGAERVRNKPHEPPQDKYIDMCLNCTEPKCRGDCNKIHPGSFKRRTKRKNDI